MINGDGAGCNCRLRREAGWEAKKEPERGAGGALEGWGERGNREFITKFIEIIMS